MADAPEALDGRQTLVRAGRIGFGPSDFGLLSDFGLRISELPALISLNSSKTNVNLHSPTHP